MSAIAARQFAIALKVSPRSALRRKGTKDRVQTSYYAFDSSSNRANDTHDTTADTFEDAFADTSEMMIA